jgi:ORF6N domain
MASKKSTTAEMDGLENFIYEIGGQKVMLDADLANVDGVTTARLKQQVKRNQERFPTAFVFQLLGAEYQNLMSQIATSKTSRDGRRKLPYAITEHGAIMGSMVLNAERAIQMSVYVVRAYARMRALLGERRESVTALRLLEKELSKRVNVQEAEIVSILQRLLDIIDPPALSEPPKREIGFHVKEASGRYAARRPS